MKKMKKQLVNLLNIQAPSGQEHKVKNYVRPILKSTCDKVWDDSYGNLLAEKVVGSGKGATVILSAHMDSVNRLDKNRKVKEVNGKFYSTKGVLGADDRAGIAIILATIRNIEKTGFEGKIKVSFSREEEIGCVGVSKIDSKWISDSDLAIVVDRRGNKDIVVGTWGQPFCSNKVGDFFENCSAMQDMNWQATEGGISDATRFSELGVNSVNLSAGYENEHTDKEYVIFDDMKKTVNLILQSLALVNDFVGDFGVVPSENKWVDDYGYSDLFYYGDTFIDDEQELWNGKERFGLVDARMVDGNVCITQLSGKKNKVEDEIFIEPSTFEKIINAYYLNQMSEMDVEFSESKSKDDFKDSVKDVKL